MTGTGSEGDGTHVQAGCPSAWAELWQRHDEALCRSARAVAGAALDDADIEDVVQEAWLRAWRARRSYDPGRPAGPWLRAIVRNVARHRLRRRGRSEREIARARAHWYGTPPVPPDQAVEAVDLAAAVAEALAEMTPRRRRVLERAGEPEKEDRASAAAIRKRRHDGRADLARRLRRRGYL